MENTEKLISKIQLPDGSSYDIKDEYLRHVLLGREEPDERD